MVRVSEGGPDDVERVWHEPETVQPGTQWEGFIRFRANHSIEKVKMQICDVGRVCFAPPIPIFPLRTMPDGRTWMFNTTDYRDTLSGRPIQYEAGWRLGVQFILTERLANGTVVDTRLPEGLENPDDLEFHYFAFDMPKATERSAPSLASGIMAVVALLAAALRRR